MARAAILFFALVLLALMSRWVADLIAPQPVVSKPVRHTPDFYLTQVQAWAMDEQGKLQHRMNAERITHFGDDNSVELTQPLFFSFDGDRPRWTITAESGISDAEGDVIHLHGAVLMERQGSQQGILKTRDLLLKPQRDYAETAAEVSFADASGVITAIGLRGHLGEGGHLELLSTVRGTHEPSKR